MEAAGPLLHWVALTEVLDSFPAAVFCYGELFGIAFGSVVCEWTAGISVHIGFSLITFPRMSVSLSGLPVH